MTVLEHINAIKNKYAGALFLFFDDIKICMPIKEINDIKFYHWELHYYAHWELELYTYDGVIITCTPSTDELMEWYNKNS